MNKQQAEQTIRQVLAQLSVPLAKHQELQKLMDLIVAPAIQAPVAVPAEPKAK